MRSPAASTRSSRPCRCRAESRWRPSPSATRVRQMPGSSPPKSSRPATSSSASASRRCVSAMRRGSSRDDRSKRTRRGWHRRADCARAAGPGTRVSKAVDEARAEREGAASARPRAGDRTRGTRGAGRIVTITNRFDTVSPMDSRFYGGDPALYKALHPYLSAAAAIKYMARVEGALALALADVGITDKNIANAIASVADRITAQEVADEETRTRHDVRALVNVIRNQVPDEAKRFVHLGATSYDIVDTANALRYRECTDRVVVPTIAVLIAKCISITEAEAETAQNGRTHGRD